MQNNYEELIDKLFRFELSSTEIIDFTQKLEEEILFDFDTFKKYYNQKLVFDALKKYENGEITGDYLNDWSNCYACLLNAQDIEKFSFVDELKASIVECLFDLEVGEGCDTKEELDFLKYTSELLESVLASENLMTYCMVDKYEEGLPRLNYLVIDETNKKYCFWFTVLMVEKSMIVEPIITKSQFYEKIESLQQIGYEEF